MKDVQLNYIGLVDANDIGRRTFRLSDILTKEELRGDPELELSVELVTENTNGQLAARVRLTPIRKSEDNFLVQAEAASKMTSGLFNVTTCMICRTGELELIKNVGRVSIYKCKNCQAESHVE